MLWTPRSGAVTLRHASEFLGPATIYADKVQVLISRPPRRKGSEKAGIRLHEMSDLHDFRRAVGDAVEFQPIDMSMLSFKTLLELIQAAGVEMETGSYGKAKEFLRLAYAGLVDARKDKHSPLMRELHERNLDDFRQLIRAAATGQTSALQQIRSTMRVRPSKGDIDRARHYAAIQPFLSSALDVNTYAVVDNIRQDAQHLRLPNEFLLREGPQQRAAHASLALGSIRRLPTIEALDWDVVRDVRSQLSTPLGRFRGAMSKLSGAADKHPLAEDFDAYVERVWIEELNPALAELEETSRESSYRSVFRQDIWSDVKSYAGPAFALTAGTFAHLSATVQAGISAASPIAAALSSRAKKRRALARQDYYFLHAVEKRLAEAY
jgi:hypothetical protein